MPGVVIQRPSSDLARFADEPHTIQPLKRASTNDNPSRTRRDDVRQRLFAWIDASTSTTAFASEAEYSDNISKKHPGTAEWIVDNELFNDWLKVRKAPPLLITALPGSGKTVLASAITNHLREKGFKSSIFYYSVARGRKAAESLLAALAHDLLIFSDFEPNDLVDLYRTELADNHHVLDNLFTAMRVVEILLKTSDRVHIVIDGLDECQDRNKLFMILQQLLRAKTYGVVKWLFTSRPDYKIREKLTQSQVVELEAPAHAIKGDVRSFVRSRTSPAFEELFDCLSTTGDEFDTNFLWATKMVQACQDMVKLAEQSAGCRTIGAADQATASSIDSMAVIAKLSIDNADGALEIEQIAGSTSMMSTALPNNTHMDDKIVGRFVSQIMALPRTMNSLYVRSLNQLATLPADKQKVAKKLLSFVIAAQQPLRVSELAQALVTTSRIQDYSTVKLPTTALISSLGTDLISFDYSTNPDDPTVRVPHKSVLEFLSTDKHTPGLLAAARGFLTDTKIAERMLGETCVQYLSHPRYRYARDIASLLDHKDHSFLWYAATCWHKHLNVEKPDIQVLSRVQDFMKSPNFWTCVVVQSIVAPYTFARYIEDGEQLRSVIGNQLLPSADLKVQWGFPLPWYLQSSTAKLFLELVIQWHHILNTYPDQLQHCRMESSWELKWPEYRQWVTNARGPVRTISSSPDDPDNLNVVKHLQERRPLRLCCVTRIVLGMSFHTKLTSSESQVLTCYCTACSDSLSRDGVNNTLVEDSTIGRLIEFFETTKLLREGTTSTSSPLDTKWNYANYSSNVILGGNAEHPAMALQWAQLDDSRRKPISDLSKRVTVGLRLLSHAEGLKRDMTSLLAVREHCLLIHRRELPSISYFWKSDHRMLYTICAYHPQKAWICWSPKIGKLCIARKEDSTVEEVNLPEIEHADAEKAHTMYREMHYSSDGTHLWRVYFTISSEEDTGLDHILGVTCFEITGDDEGEVKLEMKKTVTIKYSSCGSVVAPGVSTVWTEEYLWIIMPPSASKPKVVRLLLDPSHSATFETLIEPIYFPSTTCARAPRLLTWPANEDEDFLVLLLAAEIPRLSNKGAASRNDVKDSTPPGDGISDKIAPSAGLLDDSTTRGNDTLLKRLLDIGVPTDNAYRAARPDDSVLQGSHRIAWKINRIKDWRPWNDEDDAFSDDYKLLLQTKETLDGTYVAKNRPLPVTTRCDLNWKQQAELTCC